MSAFRVDQKAEVSAVVCWRVGVVCLWIAWSVTWGLKVVGMVLLCLLT